MAVIGVRHQWGHWGQTSKYQNFQKFGEKYQKGKIKESIFEKAHKCLTRGSKLPDEFPIREEVLKYLVRVEFMKGNSERAIFLLDELGSKYPKGEHGRRAAKWKQELLDIQKRKAK